MWVWVAYPPTQPRQSEAASFGYSCSSWHISVTYASTVQDGQKVVAATSSIAISGTRRPLRRNVLCQLLIVTLVVAGLQNLQVGIVCGASVGKFP